MSKNATNATPSAAAPVLNDFVRDAIREKAARELATLNQRVDAYGRIERSRDSLFHVANDLGHATTAAAIAAEPSLGAKLKKLRKAVDDAHLLVTEIAEALDVDKQKDALSAAQQSIVEAMKAAGLDPDTVATTNPPAVS